VHPDGLPEDADGPHRLRASITTGERAAFSPDARTSSAESLVHLHGVLGSMTFAYFIGLKGRAAIQASSSRSKKDR